MHYNNSAPESRTDRTRVALIHIDDWDFNWQGTYTFAQPIPLPAGTRIDMVSVFDNSAENLRQPSRPPGNDR